VNPAHLFLGTKLENTRDMDAKGRRRSKYGGSPPPLRIGEAHHKAKLTEADVRAIRAEVAAGRQYAEIARERDMHKSTIRRVALGKYWPHIS
jgi:DNA invertase Pin-like site-specific DNA recombinase